jgi:hypothetical protein
MEQKGAKAHQAALIPHLSKRGAWLRKLPNGILLLWRGVEPASFRLPRVQPELLPMPLSQLGVGSLGGGGASGSAETGTCSLSGTGHSSARPGRRHLRDIRAIAVVTVATIYCVLVVIPRSIEDLLSLPMVSHNHSHHTTEMEGCHATNQHSISRLTSSH